MHDQDGPTKVGLRSTGCIDICPPHLTAQYYHFAKVTGPLPERYLASTRFWGYDNNENSRIAGILEALIESELADFNRTLRERGLDPVIR